LYEEFGKIPVDCRHVDMIGEKQQQKGLACYYYGETFPVVFVCGCM
jgi:hypothetical protein